MAVLVKITPDSPRDDLLICLEEFTAQAKQEARRGFSGVNGRRYADLHDTIDALLDAMSNAPLATLGSE